MMAPPAEFQNAVVRFKLRQVSEFEASCNGILLSQQRYSNEETNPVILTTGLPLKIMLEENRINDEQQLGRALEDLELDEFHFAGSSSLVNDLNIRLTFQQYSGEDGFKGILK